MVLGSSLLSPLVRAALVAAAFVLAAPALAEDPVYIWRDASGTVRFSPVPEPEPHRDVETTVVSAGETQPAPASDADTAGTPY